MEIERDLHTPICDLLGCRYPILQAGMGGVARSELVATVTEAGGYGFLGMVRESPDLIAREIDKVRARTDRPFGVNLIPAATDPDLLEAELSICVKKRIHSLCFFWEVHADVIARAKAAGCRVLYQVGSVEDAVAAAQAGADAIIAQGVASGESLVAAFALGAQGIHCGTAFLATEESLAHAYHKDRVIRAKSEDTVYTDAFAINWPPDSPVRVIANSLTDELGRLLLGHRPEDIPREAIADEDGRPIYNFSTDSPLRTTTGNLECLALFAGQIAGAIETIPSAGGRVGEIVSSARVTLERLQRVGTATV